MHILTKPLFVSIINLLSNCLWQLCFTCFSTIAIAWFFLSTCLCKPCVLRTFHPYRFLCSFLSTYLCKPWFYMFFSHIVVWFLYYRPVSVSHDFTWFSAIALLMSFNINIVFFLVFFSHSVVCFLSYQPVCVGCVCCSIFRSSTQRISQST